MRYADFLAKGYRSFFAAFVALLLGMVSLYHPLIIQAQDAGQQAEVTRSLVIDTSGVKLNPLCLGSQVQVPLIINSEIHVAGESDAGSIDQSAVEFTVTSNNFDVVNAQPSTGEPGVSSTAIATSMTLTATGSGKATITVSAKVATNTSVTDFFPRSIEVEVAPCRYKVEVKSLWITTIVEANVFLRISAKSDMVMNPTTGLFEDQPSFIWEATTNHIKGCLASHWVYPALKGNGGSFEGRIKDDQLVLTVQMRQLDGAGVLFLCDRPTTKNGERITSCADYPDGVCDPQVPDPTMSPDNAPMIDIAFPLEGGTRIIPQRIQYGNGGANGKVIIKVTPIK